MTKLAKFALICSIVLSLHTSSSHPFLHMQLGRSELIKTLEAGAFALTLILLALAQVPAVPGNLGLLIDTVSLSHSR